MHLENILLDRARQLIGDVELGDDIHKMIIVPISELYDSADIEFKKNKVEFIENQYRTMDFTELCRIAKDEFMLVEDFISLGDDYDSRAYIFEKIKAQRSLDNLSKSGVRAYYEELGYSNVRVKYDKVNKKLEIFGDLKDGVESKTINSIVNNGKASLQLKNGEEVIYVDEVKIQTSTGNEVTIFSYDDIKNRITTFFNSENIKEDLTSFVNSVITEFIKVENGEIKLLSPALSTGIISIGQSENYEAVVKGSDDLKKDIDDVELLSASAVAIIKKINDKITSINATMEGLGTSASSLKNAVNAKYSSIMETTVDKLGLLTQTIGSANDILVEYGTKALEIKKLMDDIAASAESLPEEKTVTEFVNEIQRLNSSLVEIIS